jgi:hypothetical protein
MTVVAVVLGWTAVSAISGLFLGTLLYRFGGEVASFQDPVGTLDGSAVISIEAYKASRSRRPRR